MLYIFPNDSVIFKNGECSIWKENQYNKLEECCCCEVFTDVIPLRFTGLKDKNGKKIYEKDIVKVTHKKDRDAVSAGVVYFLRGTWLALEQGYARPLFDDDVELEVIGDIYRTDPSKYSKYWEVEE